MVTVSAEEKRKNEMFKGFLKKRYSLEMTVNEGVEIVQNLIDAMEAAGPDTDSFITANSILEIENQFEKYGKRFQERIEERHYLPVCWEEIWKINSSLKSLIHHFVMIFNKNQIFKNRESYTVFYDYEKRFLNNVKAFFTEYLKNRKYVYEVLVNNQLELKNFMKIYFNKINSICGENIADADCKIKILEIFEQINETNEIIQNSMNKIFVATKI